MNIILGIVSIFITFSIVVLMEKIFKKEGLFVWVSIATITANILVCKNIEVFGFVTNLGNVLFASNFLATDIISEKYGFKESKKAVIMGVTSQIIFLLTMSITLLYTPSSIDQVNDSMNTLFSINLRVNVASLIMYFISNMSDIYLYEFIKKKVPNKLWIRNNVSTIISNCVENYIFTFLAFVGIYGFKDIMESASVASIIEIIIAICDTPFLYFSKNVISNKEQS